MKMTTADPSRVEILVPQDERLIAAVEAVVAHASERAGLSAEEQAELTIATEEACRETFQQASRGGALNPVLRIVVCDFPERVEVSIEESNRPGAPAGRAASEATSARQPEAISAAPQPLKVDHLDHETREGGSRTHLVKHHASAKRSSHL
jgi:anti-sigma regulatory factor (Ser/Thr protein kinase)